MSIATTIKSAQRYPPYCINNLYTFETFKISHLLFHKSYSYVKLLFYCTYRFYFVSPFPICQSFLL